MKPSEPSRNESNSFFDEDARRRLEEICSEPSFLEQIEEIAVRYKLDICVIGNRKSFKERMRLLDSNREGNRKAAEGFGDWTSAFSLHGIVW